MQPVAVIDIGSNSIKVLVATRAADGSVAPLKIRTIDARISAGISHANPRLREAGMVAGLEAIRALLAEAAAYQPEKVLLVATSAVRDAANGAEFRAAVRAATGHEIRILSGDEEANLIGRGLTCDPALRGLDDFYVFDLGGGSLECLRFCQRRIEQAVSLQLGCVRLTEKFVAEADAPIPEQTLSAIQSHVRGELQRGGFLFALPSGATAVGTGGTMATARSILGARTGTPFERTSPVIALSSLRTLLAEMVALPLGGRKEIAGLPPPRADVFPTALATFVALAEAGGFAAFHNSVYNLRYGLADEALARSR